MPGIILDKETLIIGNREPDSQHLTPYLTEDVHHNENAVFHDGNVYSFCKKELAKNPDAVLKCIKFENWDMHYQSVLLGPLRSRLDSIEEIDLSNCLIRDQDIPAILVCLRECKNLNTILLNDNYLSNDSMELLLKTLVQMQNLEYVDLSRNDISYQMTLFIQQTLASSSKITVLLDENLSPDQITITKPTVTIEMERNSRAFLGQLATEFKPGDLLYGLSEGVPEDKGRNPVLTALKVALPPQQSHQLLIINPFSDWVVNKNNYEGASRKDFIIFNEFLEELIPSLYPKDGRPFIKGWSEHKAICKLGVMWAKRNDKTIHYVLDDLKMEEFSSGSRNRADTSVTESEIKFIARFYPQLKDNVAFWRTDPESKKLVKALAPWEDPKTKKHWEGYLESQHKKMRFFPGEELPKNAFFRLMKGRKDLSMIAYHVALEELLQDVLDKSKNDAIPGFIGKYLTELLSADNKPKIEKLLFAMHDEYRINIKELKDDNLELLFDNIIKQAKEYENEAPDKRFFYRRPMMARVFGTTVLDMHALFKLASELEKNASPDALGNPRM